VILEALADAVGAGVGIVPTGPAAGAQPVAVAAPIPANLAPPPGARVVDSSAMWSMLMSGKRIG
jgi:hypothetical protein